MKYILTSLGKIISKGKKIDKKIDKKKLKEINELLKNIGRNPFDEIGNAEPLNHKYSGFLSRRIDSEHRLIGKFREDEIFISKSRFHYA